MRRSLTLALVLAATTAAAQTTTTRTDVLLASTRAAIGTSTAGTGPLRVVGLSGAATGALLVVDASGDIGTAGTVNAATTFSSTFQANGTANLYGTSIALGNATSDTLTIGARLGSGLTWATDNTYDIGASGANRPRALYLSGGATIGGTLGVSGVATFSNDIGSSLIPSATDTYELGSAAKLWSQGWISQLNAVIFAETTATLFGGWSIVGKNAGSLAASVTSGATTVDFGRSMTVNHWVLIRAHDTGGTAKAEYLLVGSNVSGTTYNVTRDLAGAHGTDPAWSSGTPYLVLGAAGDGRIELLAYTTPRISIVSQGATYGAITEQVRIGYLDGMPGMATGKVGLYIGDTTGAAGLSYYDGTLTVKGAITSTSGAIGGWALGATSLTAGSGGTTVGLDSGGTNPALYAGSATPGAAPFRVTAAGALTATSATITGTVNFGSGTGVLDSTGAYVAMNTGGLTFDNDNAYRLTASDNGVSGMGGAYTTGGKYVWLRSENLSTGDFGRVRLEAKGKTDGGSVRTTYLEASAGYLDGSDTLGEYVDVSAGWLNGLSTSGTSYLRFNLGGAAGTVPSYLYSNDSEVNLYVGRNANEYFSIRVIDGGTILESVQDENSPGYGYLIYRVDDDGTADARHIFQKKSGAYADVEAAGLFLRNWIDNAGNGYACAAVDGSGDGYLYYKATAACGTSSLRFKEHVRPLDLVGVEAILHLTPVTYTLKANPGAGFQFGAIAEQAAGLGLEWLVERDDEGLPRTLLYDRIPLYLIPVVKAQRDELRQLRARVAALEAGQNQEGQ